MSAPLIRRLDLFPDLLDLHCAQPSRYPHLLESATPGGPQARYDILFAFPGERLELAADGRLSGARHAASDQDFLAALDQLCASRAVDDASHAELPFFGGWFVYFGYELAAQIEPSLTLPPARSQLPTALAQRIPAAVIRDHRQHCTWLVAEHGQDSLLQSMAEDLAALTPCGDIPHVLLDGVLREDEPQLYLDAVARIREYILAGDVFQVNLSRCWRGHLRAAVRPHDIYRRLRKNNPAPFAALATWGDHAVLSSSPERLVRVDATGSIETRPIAGTRPRGIGDVADAAYSRELLVHPKERAEHVMLIDLERNDLGRVCVAGSIEVNELMVLESYSHVHHIVSNVRGQLRPNVTPGAVIRAVFPGGTITGCPKVRCMEIIAELEGEGRGAYTGALGYINTDGSMDLNILIRTLVSEGAEISFRAGAGIVADSQPEQELAETRAKARGMVLALANVKM